MNSIKNDDYLPQGNYVENVFSHYGIGKDLSNYVVYLEMYQIFFNAVHI